MTDEQINWAITEAIGADPHWKCAKDYCNDLNAMHEAEKTLVNQFTTIEETYWRNLQHIKPHPIYATARQRAEAFLRTLGKWLATDKDSLSVQPTTEQSSVVQDLGWPPPGTRISKMNADGKWEEVQG